MQYSRLGNTDLKVSKICLGTMTFGEQNSEAEGHDQLDYALKKGINFIDTAEMYAVPGRKETQGSTERIIGSWIKARKNRDQFILASKVTGPSAGLAHIRNPLKFNREQINTAIEGSLQRLQTDYVDLYQLHWPERKTNFFGKRGYPTAESPTDQWKDNLHSIIEVLNDLVKAGKIRHWGLSNETAWGAMRYLHLAEMHDLPRPVSIQNPYSLLNRLYEVGLSEVSIRENCGLLAYSPMAFGLLSGKYHTGMARDAARLNIFKQMSRYNSDNSHEATAKYLAIAEKYDISLAQLSLAFVNTRPFVTANIIGATSMEQLRENIDSIQLEISPEIMKEINAVHEQIPNPAP
ncbi:MAG TPA: NADP(H)-dependent aldo-keto reductase [Saprospiraceae bacterium]|nr:NADP(H)-dependent aldo-keto reductase [Saprospiraceae bacterium]